MSFGTGNSLELPQAIRPPTSIDILKSEPKQLLRNARIFYVSSESQLISVKMMENALMKKPEFEKWKLALIQQEKNADIIINVEHQLFTFDYRYTMIDRQTSLVLASGKVTVWDGKIASKKFADKIIAKLKQLRTADEKPDPKIEAAGKTVK